MIGCDNVQGTTRVLRRVLFRDNIVFHAAEIEDGGAVDVQGETPYLTNDFASTGLLPITLGAPGNVLGDDIPVQFIRRIT